MDTDIHILLPLSSEGSQIPLALPGHHCRDTWWQSCVPGVWQDTKAGLVLAPSDSAEPLGIPSSLTHDQMNSAMGFTVPGSRAPVTARTGSC